MLNILVICTGNSCRSIIGEALLNHLGKGRIKAFSAGSQPLGRLNAGAVALLQRHGISTEGFASKSWEVFEAEPIDLPLPSVIAPPEKSARPICGRFPKRTGEQPIRAMSEDRTKRYSPLLKTLIEFSNSASTKCWLYRWKTCPARHLQTN